MTTAITPTSRSGAAPALVPAVALAIRTGEVNVGGVRSPYIEAGDPAADEAVVFVHGNPGSREDWWELVAQAGRFGRAIAPDMPGFGEADKPEHFTYTVDGYAAHLGGVIERLGVRRAHLVLHDFGGPWGLAWAAANPEAVASVALVNTGVMPGYRWHYLARIWRMPLLGETFMRTSTYPAFRLLLKHGNPRGLPADAVKRMWAFFDRRTRRAVLKLYRATGRPGELADQLIAALRPLDLPAVVVWGAHDPYIPVRYAARQREAFPNAEIHILGESGHWPFLDDPDGVARAVIPFLRRQLAAQRSN